MKTKLLSIMLAVMVAVTFTPASVFAVSSFGSYDKNNESVITLAIPDKTGQKIYVKYRISKNSKIRHNDNLVEVMKQALREEKTLLMDSFTGKEEYYCPEVWAEIEALSNEFDQKLEDAESVSDIGDFFIGILILKEDLAKLLVGIQGLQQMTIQQVSSASDLAMMKNNLKKEIATSFKQYKKSDFTEYYWGILCNKKAEVLQNVDKIKTFSDYVYTKEEAASTGFASFSSEEELDGQKVKIRSFSDLMNSKDDDSIMYYSSDWLHTKDDVESNKEMFCSWAEDLLSTITEEYEYKTAKQDFASQLEKTQKAIRSEVDCDVMYLDYLNFEDEVFEKARDYIDSKEQASTSDIIRLQKKLTDVFMKYKKADYSSAQWNALDNIYNDYMDKVEYSTLQDQLKDSVVTEMKKEMDKVPTLKKEKELKAKKELKQLKNKRIKQIRKYAESKKFNHKKSIPLAKKAVKKIKAAKTTTQVNKIYKTYKKKISKTVKK